MLGNLRGALLLVAAAVRALQLPVIPDLTDITLQTERAWTLATAGTFELEKPSAFTEKLWSSNVPFYLRSIELLPGDSWTNINTLAMEFKNHPELPVDVIDIADDDEDAAMYSDSDSDADAEESYYDSQEDCDALIVSL